MGGYHQFDGETPGVFLQPSDVVKLVSEGQIVPPSAEELLDRSKTDTFSKIIVLVQTLWFVMQCIARLIQRHPRIDTTELEIATLAYTTVIVGAYTCWWNKPLAVTQPIRIAARVWGCPPSEDRGNGFDSFFGTITGKNQTCFSSRSRDSARPNTRCCKQARMRKATSQGSQDCTRDSPMLRSN